jgi:hypothetical protein
MSIPANNEGLVDANSFLWQVAGPAALSAGMLLLGIESLPYGYYQALRVIVTAIAVWLATQSHGTKEMPAVFVFGVVAVVLNPILPFRFTKEAWRLLDAGAAIVIAGTVTASIWRASMPKALKWAALVLTIIIIAYVGIRFGVGFEKAIGARPRRVRP